MAGYLRSIFRRFRGTKEDDELDSETQQAAQHTLPVDGAFKTKRAVVVPAPQPKLVPVLAEVEGRLGGIQGLSWYWRTLKMDEEDDVAHDFLSEVSPPLRATNITKRPSHFSQVLGRTFRSVQGKGEVKIEQGNVHQSVEAAGRTPSW